MDIRGRTIGSKWSILADNEEMQLIKTALERYVEQAKNDLTSRYNDSETYSVEDDVFLGHIITTMSKVLFKMQEAKCPDDAV